MRQPWQGSATGTMAGVVTDTEVTIFSLAKMAEEGIDEILESSVFVEEVLFFELVAIEVGITFEVGVEGVSVVEVFDVLGLDV